MLRTRVLAALLTALLPARAAAQGGWDAARQAVVVTTEGWAATEARVELWERRGPRSPWRRVGQPFPAMVGRGGLGWGTGLHPAVAGDPQKREGDGRAPAGIFRLSSAFGYAPQSERSRFPYRQSTGLSRCVDDGKSAWYNRWVEADQAIRDWSSHEAMRRTDSLYRLGVWVDHNSAPPRAGGGSCIFLHLWAGPGVATVGCTSMAPEQMERLVAWLDASAAPVLVQLPRDEYRRRRAEWRLP